MLPTSFKIFPAYILFLFYSFCTVAQVNDWEHPEKVSLNTQPPHAYYIPYPDEAQAIKKGSSSFEQSLDGTWKFKLVNTVAERPLDFYKTNFDTKQWSNIKVPANWQTEGFDKFIFTDVEYPISPNPPFVPKDYNPVGSYKRAFTVSKEWKNKNVFIHLGAVNSFFYLWINDHYVGFSKDSKTPAEFDITPFLQKGANSVSVQVFRFSDGTYLEGQDMWKLSGMDRSVYLIARPKLSVYDFFVKAGLDKEYKNGVSDLSVMLNKQPSGNQSRQSLEIKILDADGKLIYKQQSKLGLDTKFNFHDVIKNVKSWNAENPNLYTLLINLLDARGKPLESIAHRIGFRNIEISHGLFLVNGIAVKIKGVNRHEHDMVTAKVVSYEGMLNDIRVMKRYNINAVRNSHYPNREEWYELCDQYGIYVIDEANIECDGMSFSPLNTLSDKPDWKAAYLDRTKRMFERDKNFCSVITWSLGNESRFGENFIATYNYLKANDSTRPVQYEEARENTYTDIFCPMYKGIGVLQEYAREWHARPLILCEYAHMMGNSGGNLKDDWDLINRYEQLQGGFIWDFSDQTFLKKDRNGRNIWAYGRDMGNVGATSDTSFCADGLFTADRKPHPQAFELKKVYQPVNFEPVNFSKRTVRITNRFDFTDLNQFSFNWLIKANGKLLLYGEIDTFHVAPHQSKEINLNILAFEPEPGVEYFLTIEAHVKENSGLLPAGHTIAWEQFEMPGIKKMPTNDLDAFAPLMKAEETNGIKIYNEKFAVSFNKETGWLQWYVLNNNSIIKEPLVPYFWRAATDNDIGNSQQIRCAVWQHAGDFSKLDSFNVEDISSKQVCIKTMHYLSSVDAMYFVQYLVSANGNVQMSVKMKAGNKYFPEMPRFGMRVILDDHFEKVTWFGRGPFDNYWDRKYAAPVDLYSMPADSLFFPYPRAQESGYRTDVRWMALQNKNGLGIMAEGSPLISTGVLHFDMKKLDFDRNAIENNHGGSMTHDPLIWWNIDYKQMGVGGDNAWGAKTHAEYMLPYRDYEYSFLLRPVYGNEDMGANK